MDRYTDILHKYANGRRCIVIFGSDDTRREVVKELNETAARLDLPKPDGVNVYVSITEDHQKSKLENRAITAWWIKTVYKKKYLELICQHRYDYLYVYDLKDRDVAYVRNAIGKCCTDCIVDCSNVTDDSISVYSHSTGSSDNTLTNLMEDLTLDCSDSSSINTISSSEFMREKLSILTQNSSANSSIRRSTTLSKTVPSSKVSTIPITNIKTKCKDIHVDQCTVVNVPKTVTKYIKRYSPGSTIVSLINVSSTASNDEHTYYIDAISRLNKGRIYTWKKTNSTDSLDCIFVCSDHTVRPISQYKQLIYIVDDPGRCRSNYSKKFGEELSNCIQNILSLDVQKIVIICTEYYSGHYRISSNVQPHPIHELVSKYSKSISICPEVHSKYSIPTKCTAADYIRSTNPKYNVTVMRPVVDAATLDMIVEQLIYTFECPYDEETASSRWYSIDTNIADTYYSPDGTLVDFTLNYRSSAGYLYCTDLDNLLVSLLFYGLRTGIYIDTKGSTVCYLITR